MRTRKEDCEDKKEGRRGRLIGRILDFIGNLMYYRSFPNGSIGNVMSEARTEAEVNRETAGKSQVTVLRTLDSGAQEVMVGKADFFRRKPRAAPSDRAIAFERELDKLAASLQKSSR